ncbi:MAG: D-alanyl-D-alanine carboxypeptidase family protein [Ruminococcus sp.]|nr:D-alanyl-D-alanine carboxypeptidase family protein [Ruminococcus sp.]
MKKKILLSKIMAAAIIAGCFSSMPSSARSSIKGDVNGDSIIGFGDLRLIQGYVLGNNKLTADQMKYADVDGDGRVDAFDLALLKENFNEHMDKIPQGTWVASGSKGKRYYNFEKGTVTEESSGAVTSYKCTVSETNLNFDKNVCGDAAHALFSWTSDNTFVLRWDKGYVEELHYYGNAAINYSSLLSGKYVTSGGYGKRTFNFRGISGSFTGQNGSGLGFEYTASGNNYTFYMGTDRKPKKAVYKKIDSMHFSLTWDDGTVERFTKQDIQTKNGITYVNGILIANKTYGLPSTYNPGAITSDAQAAFNKMKADAAKAGYSLFICSGFRSYSYQSQLYNSYVNRDGKAKADTYSARPGHSEHQTGLAMDINNASDAFNNTPEAKWIAANCWKYGFILRYPQGKQNITGYKYESWHVRYLGNDLAKEVYNSGLTLEEFLCIDSVYK